MEKALANLLLTVLAIWDQLLLLIALQEVEEWVLKGQLVSGAGIDKLRPGIGCNDLVQGVAIGRETQGLFKFFVRHIDLTRFRGSLLSLIISICFGKNLLFRSLNKVGSITERAFKRKEILPGSKLKDYAPARNITDFFIMKR